MTQPDWQADWHTLLEVCAHHHVTPDVVVCPDRHMEQQEVVQRGVVLRHLRNELGWKPLRIAALCPVSERTLFRAFKRRNCAKVG